MSSRPNDKLLDDRRDWLRAGQITMILILGGLVDRVYSEETLDHRNRSQGLAVRFSSPSSLNGRPFLAE